MITVVKQQLQLLSRAEVTWDTDDLLYFWSWTAPFPAAPLGSIVCALSSVRMVSKRGSFPGSFPFNPSGAPYGYAVSHYGDGSTKSLLTYPPTFGNNPKYEHPDPREQIVSDYFNPHISWLDGHAPWEGVQPYVPYPYTVYDHSEGFGAGPYDGLAHGFASPPFEPGESGTTPFVPSPYADVRMNGTLKDYIGPEVPLRLTDGPSFTFSDPKWRSALEVDGVGAWHVPPFPRTMDFHFYGTTHRNQYPEPITTPPLPQEPIRWLIEDTRLIFIIISLNPGHIDAGHGVSGVRRRHRIVGSQPATNVPGLAALVP